MRKVVILSLLCLLLASPAYSAFSGQKTYVIDIDDTYASFDWLRQNPTAPSIWGNSFFAWLKATHETYGTVFICPVFYVIGTGVTLNDVVTNDAWKAEFAFASHFLRFSFHSYNSQTVYPGTTCDWCGTYGVGAGGRTQTTDFGLVKDEITRICGAGSFSASTTTHFWQAGLTAMQSIDGDYSNTVVWLSSSYDYSLGYPEINSNYYFYFPTSSFETDAWNNGYYYDGASGRNWFFIPWSFWGEAYGSHEDSMLAAAPDATKNIIVSGNHEASFVSAGVYRTGVTNLSSYCNSNSYVPAYPTEAYLNKVFGYLSDNPLISMSISPTTPSITAGSTQQLTATGTYADGTTADLTSSVTWSMFSTDIATISSGGLATGVSAGTTSAKALSGGVGRSIAFEVTENITTRGTHGAVTVRNGGIR